MTSWPALDVAIGLIFVYFLLSLFTSNINEAFAAWFKLRARDLERWLATVLVDDEKSLKAQKTEFENRKTVLQTELDKAPGAEHPGLQNRRAELEASLKEIDGKLAVFSKEAELTAQKEALASFFANPVISAGMKKDRPPSYVARQAFSAVVTAAPAFADFDEVPKKAKEAIANLPSAYLRRVATSLCDDATQSAADLRTKLEAWYDESMQRVSGWYKRRAQLYVFLIGLALVIGLNIDTIQITRTLWSDSTVRAAVVAAAGNAAQSGQSPSSTAVAKEVQDLSASNLPLGWGAFDVTGTGEWLLKGLGWLITALAVVLGAPFWFDLLSRFTNVRFNGAPPKTTEG